MDPLALLMRSSRSARKSSTTPSRRELPSNGAVRNPQLFGATHELESRKRKRGEEHGARADPTPSSLDFFGRNTSPDVENSAPTLDVAGKVSSRRRSLETDEPAPDGLRAHVPRPSEDERKRLLRTHKLKITLLEEQYTPAATPQIPESLANGKKKKKEKQKQKSVPASNVRRDLFPQPVTAFSELRQRYGISKCLARNIEDQGYRLPTEVQMAGLPLLLTSRAELMGTDKSSNRPGVVGTATDNESTPMPVDLLAVAPTGSGKTLAFMIPLINALAQSRRVAAQKDSSPQAFILAPTKELANQIVNEGRKLALNTGIQITSVRKGMHIDQAGVSDAEVSGNKTPPVKSDILVSTPMTMLHAIGEIETPPPGLAAVRFLVLDEADVLLDPLFRDQTLAIWNAITHPDLRVNLWSATMGSNVEELAKSIISSRARRLSSSATWQLNSAPLVRLVVGLKDSAVPNIDHQLTYAASEQGKLMALRQLLHPTSRADDGREPLRAPFLVFTQTIERAVALHSELLYDIPPEAGGISRIAVLHSDLSDTARDKVMTRFRKGEVWVLITTDLLSRGVDFRGINGVVNYDVPNSGAAYIHRVGRTGRAGREGGVAVTLYTKEDIPYIKNVANIIAASQKQDGTAGNGRGIQQWLLDALPTPSKRDKQLLKKRGVEARRSTGGKDTRNGAARTRISTKSGFLRRVENNRRGAMAAGQREKALPREEDSAQGSGMESDFGGFDD